MKRLPLLAALALALALAPSTASAAVIPVPCGPTGAGNSAAFIAAVEQANLVGGPDTISLSDCAYRFEVDNNRWYGANALPPIASNITVEGNGATLMRPDSAGAFRFFYVGAPQAPAPAFVTRREGALTLRNLTVTGGRAVGGSSNQGGGGAGMGGAIFNHGTLVVEGVTFRANSAVGGATGVTTSGDGGGGMVTPGSANGGGMGDLGGDSGSGGGTGGGAGGGGGAGLRDGQPGTNATAALPGDGGGDPSGTGGVGGGSFSGQSGEGSGSGGSFVGVGTGGAGGKFGAGGAGGDGGGGGGAGGGGGFGNGGGGGGGGFGGGGGAGTDGGGGGFGGGAGARTIPSGQHGAPGFGGGAASVLRGGGGAGMGGAIFNFHGSATVRNSTFTDNLAIGGGLLDAPDMGNGMGGAVFNMNGTFTAQSSTFAKNHASGGAGTSIYNLVYDALVDRQALVVLTNTIVGRAEAGSNDLASDESAYNLITQRGSAQATVGDRNIVERSAGLNGGTVTGTPITADPLLDALADNGGPTFTMMPRAGSPALDAGRAAGLTTDQRGLARPVNLPSVANFGDGADIGAVEIQVPGGPGGQPPPAFGASPLVTIRAARRIGPRGPVPVIVRNRNGFQVTGRVGASRRSVRLRPKRVAVAARSRKTVRLKLPRKLRRALRRNKKLPLRLTALVKDPAGNARLVSRRATPRLKVRRSRR